MLLNGFPPRSLCSPGVIVPRVLGLGLGREASQCLHHTRFARAWRVCDAIVIHHEHRVPVGVIVFDYQDVTRHQAANL
jgi:hypothetical protein